MSGSLRNTIETLLDDQQHRTFDWGQESDDDDYAGWDDPVFTLPIEEAIRFMKRNTTRSRRDQDIQMELRGMLQLLEKGEKDASMKDNLNKKSLTNQDSQDRTLAATQSTNQLDKKE